MRSMGSPLAVSISTGTLGCGAGQGADAPADLQAVHVGQHEVEDDEVGQVGARHTVGGLQLLQAAAGIAHVRDLQAVVAQ